MEGILVAFLLGLLACGVLWVLSNTDFAGGTK